MCKSNKLLFLKSAENTIKKGGQKYAYTLDIQSRFQVMDGYILVSAA